MDALAEDVASCQRCGMCLPREELKCASIPSLLAVTGYSQRFDNDYFDDSDPRYMLDQHQYISTVHDVFG